jgi:hypothetical protein
VHTNFDNDLQEGLEKDTEIEHDDNLSQMLSQRSTLLTRTVRHLGGPDWENDSENETQARFVDSDGEELQIDPSEEVLSTQEEDQTDETGIDDTEFDQAALAQFIVQVAEYKCKLAELNSTKYLNANGPYTEYYSDDDEDPQPEMDIEPLTNITL